VFKGIRDENPVLAQAAAVSLLCNPDLTGAEDVPLLDELLSHWSRRGSWCARCKAAVPQSSCPTCCVVPPSPRRALVRKLLELQALSQGRLLTLCSDHDNGVAGSARKRIVQIAAMDPTSFRLLVTKSANDELPVQVLVDLFT